MLLFFTWKKKSWNDFTHLLLEFFFQRGVAVRFSDTLLEETGWVWNFFHSGIAHFGDPRVGQLGQEKRRLKFSRTGKRAQGIILLTNQFYDIFECLSVFVPNQRSASIGLLSWSHKKEFTCVNSTVRRVPVWLVQGWELSSSRVFSGAPKVYFTNFIRSFCITEEKILTNSQTLKGEKILLHVPNKYAE